MRAAKRTDGQMLAHVALELLASYGTECDHYRLGDDIVDHLGLPYYSSELGFHDGDGRTLLRIAQGSAASLAAERRTET